VCAWAPGRRRVRVSALPRIGTSVHRWCTHVSALELGGDGFRGDVSRATTARLHEIIFLFFEIINNQNPQYISSNFPSPHSPTVPYYRYPHSYVRRGLTPCASLILLANATPIPDTSATAV